MNNEQDKDDQASDESPGLTDEGLASNQLDLGLDAAFGESSESLASTATFESPMMEGPGTIIGSYKLLQQLGAGGMGVVYMAEQSEPVRRKVALKIIKPGMDSRQVIARFEAERQALALMDHHHIARVLDGGTTDSGRPYFAMELVKGIPLTQYCDKNRLTPRERLELFIPVCQAVQHAHQKGIIHRDLKPSNVLVSLYDGKPVPKVIDFGIAKAIDQQLTQKTMFTEYGQIIGTLEYMSPEQAESSQLDIDTRSDVYSLGVMLYELLTGHTPLSSKELRKAGYLEVLRMIREEEPSKPSTRISESGEALSSISAQRQTDPKRLGALVRGDLDWIVMKSLEKDRTRRYESASEFSQDIERFLSHEPVLAGPQSLAYRLRKLTNKHRGLFAATSAIAATLFVATVVSGWSAYRAFAAEQLANERLASVKTERDKAKDARDAAETARKRASQAEAETARALIESERARDDAQRALNFMINAFESPNPTMDGRQLKVVEVLEEAIDKVKTELNGDPIAQATMLHTIGGTYTGLGLLEEAERLFHRAFEIRRRELGEDHRDTLNSKRELGDTYNARSRFDSAQSLLQETHRQQSQTLGRRHPDTLRTLSDLASSYMGTHDYKKALPLLTEATELQAQVLGEADKTSLETRMNLSVVQSRIGELDHALESATEAYSIAKSTYGDPSARASFALANRAGLLTKLGQASDSLPLITRAHRDLIEIRGEEHDHTLGAAEILGRTLREVGALEKSLLVLTETETVLEQHYGKSNHRTLSVMINRAATLSALSREEEAESIYRDVASAKVDILNRLEAARRLSDGELSVRVFREIIPELQRGFGKHSAAAYSFEMDYATVLFEKLDQPQEAIEVLQPMQQAIASHLPEHIGLRERNLDMLAQAKFKAAVRAPQPERKATLLKDAVETQRELISSYESHAQLGSLVLTNLKRNLGVYLNQSGQIEEARKLYINASLGLNDTEAPPLRIAKQHADLGGFLGGMGFPQDAIEPIGRALKLRKLHLRADDPLLFETYNYLGAAYRGAGELSVAQEIFQEALTKARSTLGNENATTIRLMENLGGMYSRQRDSDRAIRLFQEAFSLSGVVLGELDARTLNIMGSLAAEYANRENFEKAEQLLLDALSRSREALGDSHNQTVRLRLELADVQSAQGQFHEAIEYAIEALASYETDPLIGPSHPLALRTRSRLAMLYSRAGDATKAAEIAKENHRQTLVRLPEDHPKAIISLTNTATALENAGRRDEALALHERSIPLLEKEFGTSDSRTIKSKANWTIALANAGRSQESVLVAEQNMKTADSALGSDSRLTLEARHALGVALAANGQHERAKTVFQSNFAAADEFLGPDHYRTGFFANALGLSYIRSGDYETARELLETKQAFFSQPPENPTLDSLQATLAFCLIQSGDLDRALEATTNLAKRRVSQFGNEAQSSLSAIELVGRIHMLRGELDRSTSVLKRMTMIAMEKLGEKNQVTRRGMRTLGELYRRLGKLDQSIEVLQDLHEAEGAAGEDEQEQSLSTLDELAESLLSRGRIKEATIAIKQCIRVRKARNSLKWKLHLSQSILARIQVQQGETEEARTVLSSAFEYLWNVRSKIPYRLRGRLELAARAMVESADSTSDSELASAWRKKLESVFESREHEY
ncbi:MAG: tetratricopeptide repeat protein [Planctomycetota bacterium]